MANYLFTFRGARGDGAGTLSAHFADDGGALRHARDLLSRYAVVEVSRGATRLAHLTAPTDFGRKPRFTAAAPAARKGLSDLFKWPSAR